MSRDSSAKRLLVVADTHPWASQERCILGAVRKLREDHSNGRPGYFVVERRQIDDPVKVLVVWFEQDENPVRSLCLAVSVFSS